MAEAVLNATEEDLMKMLEIPELESFKIEFKRKVIDPLMEKVRTIKDTDIKKMLNPFGIDDAPSDFVSDIEKYRDKIKEFISIDLPKPELNESSTSNIKGTTVGNMVPTEVKNIKPQEDDGEQRDIGKKISLISFSDDAMAFLKDYFNNTFNNFFKKLVKVLEDDLDILASKIKPDGGGGLLDALGIAGIIALLADVWGIISNVIAKTFEGINALSRAFVWFYELPGKFMELLRSEGLYKFADYEAWLQLRWEKYVTEPWGRLVKNLKMEELVGTIIEEWNILKTNIKYALKLDDIGAWISLYSEEYLLKPIMGIMENLEPFGELIKNTGEGALNISGKFLEGVKGVVSFIGDFSGMIANFFKGFSKPIMTVLEIAEPLLGFIGKFARFLGPIALLIDPIVSAFKTLFSVWNDKNLSPLQKGIAVLAGFVGGFGNIVTDLANWTMKLGTGLWNFITGKGFNMENAGSKWIEKNVNEKGGLGAMIGKGTAEALGEYNNLQAAKAAGDQANQSGKEQGSLSYENASPEDGSKSQPEGTPVNDAVGKVSKVIGKDNKTYTPAPNDIMTLTQEGGGWMTSLKNMELSMGENADRQMLANNSLDQMNKKFDMLHDTNKKSLNALYDMVKAIQSMPVSKGTTVVSGGGGDSKRNFVFKTPFDPNTQSRISWVGNANSLIASRA
jgi:hypothetical protein